MTFSFDDTARAEAIKQALNSRPDEHDYVVTDVVSGRVEGVFPTLELAQQAVLRLTAPGRVLLVDVLHPATCDCQGTTP